MFLIAWLVRKLVVILLLLAIPVVALELLARKLVGDTVRSTVVARFGGSATVSFGTAPLLVQLANGRLDRVTVTDPGARIGGLPPTAATASFEDVHFTNLLGLHGAIGSVAVGLRLGPSAVRDLIATGSCAGGLADGVGAALSADPRVLLLPGHVSLLPPRGHAFEVRLVPLAAGGSLVFRLVGLVERGAGASTATVSALGARSDCARPIVGLPFNLRLTGAHADRGAVSLELQGSGAKFQE